MKLIKTKQNISVEDIYNKIGSEAIYRRYYSGGELEIGKAILSPFKKERNPSFIVKWCNDRQLHHLAFNDDSKQGSCIDFVCQLYGLSFKEALEMIGRDFGISEGDGVYIRQYEVPEVIEKEYSIIKPLISSFTEDDLAYWAQYGITKKELEDNHIYHLHKGTITKGGKIKPIWRRTNELAFVYWFPEAGIDKYKLYWPNRGSYKWSSNIPLDYIHDLKNLTNCDKGLITKSFKDQILLSKIIPEVCHVQNESKVAYNEKTISFLQENVKQVIINYDSDSTGIKNCTQICKEFGFKYVNVPKYYLKQGIKDFSDVFKLDGIDPIIKHFKKKKIL